MSDPTSQELLKEAFCIKIRSPEELDLIKQYDKIVSLIGFTCEGCDGKCCYYNNVAGEEGLYLLRHPEKIKSRVGTHPCPYLDIESKKCLNYDKRPLMCILYPFASFNPIKACKWFEAHPEVMNHPGVIKFREYLKKIKQL